MTVLAEVSDFISERTVNRHKKIVYVAYRLGQELFYSNQNMFDLLHAGILADIGTLSLRERESLLTFESAGRQHCEAAYWIFRHSTALSPAAEILRHLHAQWSEAKESPTPVPYSSHVLHLAEKIVVLQEHTKKNGLDISGIQKTLEQEAGKKFDPELVALFQKISHSRNFWLDLETIYLPRIYTNILSRYPHDLEMTGLLQYAHIMRRVIDFRSEYTHNHSLSVASAAELLAGFAGLSQIESQAVKIAGLIHELGKLSVPAEIIEKPGELNDTEKIRVQNHPYFSYRALQHIPQLNYINEAASFHHERLNGSGYPFGYDAFQLGIHARILQICDVFVALKEPRAYRPVFSDEQAIDILKTEAKEGKLDTHLVDLFAIHLDTITAAMEIGITHATDEYQSFMQHLLTAGV